MLFRHILPAAFTAIFATAALAAHSDCPQHFAGGQAPEILNAALKAKTHDLCNSGYAVTYSGVSRTALWSAQHLTRESIKQGQAMTRRNSFHVDNRLPEDEQSTMKDYYKSNMDKGHLSPSGNMPDAQAQYESFAMSNMVPQDPKQNRSKWFGIETYVQKMAIERGEIYVISGPLFKGQNLQRIGRVLVPTHLFKLVYDPSRKEAGAFLATNDSDRNYQRLSVTQLEALAGINLLPAVSPKIKAVVMDLPAPHSAR